MKTTRQLNVFYGDRKVGTLALHQNRFAAFAYDRDWISDGFSISPFSLPLESKVFLPDMDPFDGLFGVFADSLPDGWGRLLVDRLMLKHHMNPREVGNLDRLAIVGNSGMGALTYQPDMELEKTREIMDLDQIAEECARVLRTQMREEVDTLDELFALGGSSGGARPKILTQVDGEEWIIKFPSSQDDMDIGYQEYRYAQCAKACGIPMAETRLFPSEKCRGYFGTRRFDRRRNENGDEERIHMISVSALLETSHRIPNLDYETLMKLTWALTEDPEEMEKLYRQMCFNVFAHNRDDHSRNFSYLYLEKEQRWILSPAYDLTYSSSLGGEHATTVHGNGRNPGKKELLAVAESGGISERRASVIADDVRDCVEEFLGEISRDMSRR